MLQDYLHNAHHGLGPGADFCYTFLYLSFHKDAINVSFIPIF